MEILIFGCGGIGSAIAQGLLEDGHSVTVTFHSGEGAQRALELTRLGAKALPFSMGDLRTAEISLRALSRKENPYRAVIWAAGVVFPGLLRETKLEEDELTFLVNFWGPCLLLKYAGEFLPQGGKMIFLSSSTSLRESPGLAVYAASKAALNSLIMSAAEELISSGIRLYNLCLGRVATPLRKRIAPNEDPSTIMQPEELLPIVRMILSPWGDTLSVYPIRIHKGPYPK